MSRESRACLLESQVCRCCNIHSSPFDLGNRGWDGAVSNACEMRVVRPMGFLHEGVVEPYRGSSTQRRPWRMRGWISRVGPSPAMPNPVAGMADRIGTGCTFCIVEWVDFVFLKWKSEGKKWLEDVVSRETEGTLTGPCVDDSRKASHVHKHRTFRQPSQHQSSKRAHFSHFPPLPLHSSPLTHASATIALLTAALPTIGRIIQSSLPRKLASFAASRC